jgi:hypothetical protein
MMQGQWQVLTEDEAPVKKAKPIVCNVFFQPMMKMLGFFSCLKYNHY